MKMRSFIPNIEDPADSDESSDEIPPGGVFPLGGIQAADDDDDEDEINGISNDEDNADADSNDEVDGSEDYPEVVQNGVVNGSEDNAEVEANGHANIDSSEELENDSDAEYSDADDVNANDSDANDSDINDSDNEEEDEEDNDEQAVEDEDDDMDHLDGSDIDDEEDFVEMKSDSEEDSDNSDSEEGDEATMESLFGIEPNVKEANAPPDYEAKSGIVGLCFHPKRDLISAATMDGDAIVYEYSLESVNEVAKFTHHKEPCRAVGYNEDGNTLYTISKDCSMAVVDIQKEAIKHHFKEAHEAPIYSFLSISERLCATGDDDGTVKIWDLRLKKSVFDFKCGEGTVSSLITDGSMKFLCASLVDGSIAGFNIKKRRLEVQSEFYDSGMNAMALVRNESKLVVGSEEGTFYIFNWGDFGYHVDRYGGVPEEIHCVLPLADKLVLAGYDDGNIRAMHFYPHRFVGVVGEHRDFGINCLEKCRQGKYIASCSMDGLVRFWNIDYLYGKKINPKRKANIDKSQFKLESSKQRNRWDFYKDLPRFMESDEEEGPIAGPSEQMEDSDSD